jgi:hypothetical protein
MATEQSTPSLYKTSLLAALRANISLLHRKGLCGINCNILHSTFFQLVELLLRHGANPAQANSKGQIPMETTQSEEIVRLLRRDMIPPPAASSSSSLPGAASSEESSDVRSPTSPESNADNDITSPRTEHDDENSKHKKFGAGEK